MSRLSSVVPHGGTKDGCGIILEGAGGREQKGAPDKNKERGGNQTGGEINGKNLCMSEP